MASLTLRGLNDRWPEGTSLTIRPESNFGSSTPPVPGQTPLGSATDTQTVSGDAVTFVNLAADTAYVVTDAGGTKYLHAGTLVSHGSLVRTDATGHIREADLPATAELTSHKNAASGYAGTDSTSRVPLAQLGRVVEPSWNGVPFTVYVNRHDGSDSNGGTSPGDALLTLEAAVLLMNKTTHGGKIVLAGPAAGSFNVTKKGGLHAVQPIVLEGIVPAGSVIDRGFSTPNCRSVYDGVTTAAGTNLASATAAFVAGNEPTGDVNRIVSIYGAGTNGGTYYGFITARVDASNVTLDAATVIARPQSGDQAGIKVTIVGDWDRVVTDAAITTGTSTLTSATAAFSANTDIGTEVVIAGAGVAGQALRGTIKSVESATSCTLVGTAGTTVSGKRCAIGVNFGNLFSWHVPNGGVKDGIYFNDPTTDHQNRIGAAIAIPYDSGYSQSNGQFIAEYPIVTNSDTSGAWEHDVDVDGSWNQNAGGGGIRKTWWFGGTYFGARRAGETIRLNTVVHFAADGVQGGGAAPLASTAQGLCILDPGRTRPGGSATCVDVHFAGVEGLDWCLYSDAQYFSYVGGRAGYTGTKPVWGRSIHLSPAASENDIRTINIDPAEDSEKDSSSGQNNVIETTKTRAPFDHGSSGAVTITPTTTKQGIRKIVMTSGTLTVAQASGATREGMKLGFDITNSTGGVMTITWSGAYKKPAGYANPASTKRQIIWFTSDGANYVMDNTPFDY